MAYSQYEHLPIIQIADITGAYGVSFLIVLVNFSVFAITSRAKDKIKSRLLFEAVAVLFIVIAVVLYGNRQISQFSVDGDRSEGIKVSLIQGNIEQTRKWDARYKDYILNQYEKLTFKAAKDKPDIIIWPETSIPGYLNKDSRLMRYAQALVRKAGTPILVGAPMVAMDNVQDPSELNSAVLFSNKGEIVERYDKLHLVAFGEFIPLERYLLGIRKFFPITGNFIPGDEYTLFRLNKIDNGLNSRFGALICFEDIFPGLVRRFVKKGADFMVNITNDAWFGRSCAAYQHAANSVFRAVENRRPFARSANTGLTCFIDRTGKIGGKVNLASKNLFVEGYITDIVNVYPNQGLTFYTKYGDVFILLCLIFACCFMIDYLRHRKYNNKLSKRIMS